VGEVAERGQGVRLADLVATLSLAADLGLGEPAEHAIRSCVVALSSVTRSVSGLRIEPDVLGEPARMDRLHR
jgi:hypothetical protein